MRTIRLFFCTGFCLLALSCFALAADPAFKPPSAESKAVLEEAEAAFHAKEFAKAKELLQPLADSNDPYATYAMGLVLSTESDTPDMKAVESWWEKSSEAGNPQAQLTLGYLYFNGALGKKELKKARALFEKAAAQKHPQALYGLAVMQLNGAGGAVDNKSGVKNLREAANMGLPMAELELGQLYLMGRGVKPNPAKAREYIKKAADKGLPEAIEAQKAIDAAMKDIEGKKRTGKKPAAQKKPDKQ